MVETTAHKSLTLAAQGIQGAATEVCDEIETMANLIWGCEGVVTTGMGKSGYVAMKAAATFRSIGKPAIYLHPAEASHGDLGSIRSGDVVLAISNSGETAELGDILLYCAEYHVPVIGITSVHKSTLDWQSNSIVFPRVTEACPNGLAPTTSTIVSMAICDALAVCLCKRLGTSPDDFHKYHPGGKLGAALLTVGDVMLPLEKAALVNPLATATGVFLEMTSKAQGVALVVDDNELVGVITDGDMRRSQDRLGTALAADLCTQTPLKVSPRERISKAIEIMNGNRITAMPVFRDGRLCGLLHIHDCLKAS